MIEAADLRDFPEATKGRLRPEADTCSLLNDAADLRPWSVIKCVLLYPTCSDRVHRFDGSLDLPQAAVDAQFGTGDVARVIAQQEQGGRSHF